MTNFIDTTISGRPVRPSSTLRTGYRAHTSQRSSLCCCHCHRYTTPPEMTSLVESFLLRLSISTAPPSPPLYPPAHSQRHYLLHSPSSVSRGEASLDCWELWSSSAAENVWPSHHHQSAVCRRTGVCFSRQGRGETAHCDLFGVELTYIFNVTWSRERVSSRF